MTEDGHDWLAIGEDSWAEVPGLKPVTANLSDLLARDKAIASALSSNDVDRWLQMVQSEEPKPVLETYVSYTDWVDFFLCLVKQFDSDRMNGMPWRL